MAIANRPERLFISSDDLDYGLGASNFTCVLPEPVTGATGVDLARAIIPANRYPIPDYQNKFYFTISSTAGLQTLVLTNNRYFADFGSLITQLNADAVSQGFPITFTYNSTTVRISVAHNTAGQTVTAAPRTSWPTQFALNTRLGFLDAGSATAQTVTAPMLGNLISTRSFYILCDVVINNTISSDGLRTALARIPVNNIYGGSVIYVPPARDFYAVSLEAFQNVNIQILDDNYQPYDLYKEEMCEFELIFKYD
jgi:hypothetical protein